MGKYSLLDKMQELADKDARLLHDELLLAIDKYHPKKVIVVTHIPPFKEACLHEGQMSDDDWLPYFASKATGDVLLDVASNYKDISFLVLCGHTHDRAQYQALDNLEVKAEYYEPEDRGDNFFT